MNKGLAEWYMNKVELVWLKKRIARLIASFSHTKGQLIGDYMAGKCIRSIKIQFSVFFEIPPKAKATLHT